MYENTTKLRFGPYVTPIAVVGTFVECEVRGLVTIVGLSDAPLAWPIGERDGQTKLVVYKALARALRQEKAVAIAAAWGISLPQVQQWQRACNRPRRRKKQTLASPPLAWKAAEDEMVATLSLAEAARRTGRTISAVRKRRRLLGLPDARLSASKPSETEKLLDQSNEAATLLRLHTRQIKENLTNLQTTVMQARSARAYWKFLGGEASSDESLGKIGKALV